MARAWTFQKAADVRTFGEKKAPWYCGWYEPDTGKCKSKSFGQGTKGKDKAERHRFKIEDQIDRGNYRSDAKKLWADFRKEFEADVLAGLAVRSREAYQQSLDVFERIAKPVRVAGISTRDIAKFVTKRRAERGKKKGDPISPASVNKDLRHIKAALRKAKRWGYLVEVPDFEQAREPSKLPTYVTPEHFAAIYAACDTATMPDVPNVTPADWWRALLTMAYMTGWRIGDLLALRASNIDLDEGTALSMADDNKGKRDERIRLHSVVVDHLRLVKTFEPVVFPWPHHVRTLYSQFGKIQAAAGIKLPCNKSHQHSGTCHCYGFHDLRRAFATQNAPRLSADTLQGLMRHKSYATTQRYINMSKQLDEAVESLHVPPGLSKKNGSQW